MAFQVPLILIGARLGLMRSTYANYREARSSFWDETLAPLYRETAAVLTRGFMDEPGYEGFDYLEFDTSTVKALQEDEDAKHNRVRANMTAGIITREEARQALGYEPEAATGETWMVDGKLTAIEVGTEFEEPEPALTPDGDIPDAPPMRRAKQVPARTDMRIGTAEELERLFLGREEILGISAKNGRH
jgi:hypothetical protein